MYTEQLKETLLKKPHFKNVYFNENDDTQYIFHPNVNFRKVVSRDDILKPTEVAPIEVESNETETEIKTSKNKKK